MNKISILIVCSSSCFSSSPISLSHGLSLSLFLVWSPSFQTKLSLSCVVLSSFSCHSCWNNGPMPLSVRSPVAVYSLDSLVSPFSIKKNVFCVEFNDWFYFYLYLLWLTSFWTDECSNSWIWLWTLRALFSPLLGNWNPRWILPW